MTGQRGRHDEVVEGDHEQGDRGDDECPAALERVRVMRRAPSFDRDLVVTKYGGEKRGGGSAMVRRHLPVRPRGPGPEQAAQRPGLRPAAELERGGDVEQHPLREEVVDLLVGSTAVPLDRELQARRTLRERPDERLRRRTRRRPGVGRAGGRDPRAAACRPVPMRSSTLHSWSSVGRRRGRFVKDQPGPLEAVADDGEEQFPLRPEQLEQVRLRDADRSRDRLGGGAAVAARGEFVERGDDDRARGARRRSGGSVVAAAFMHVT